MRYYINVQMVWWHIKAGKRCQDGIMAGWVAVNKIIFIYIFKSDKTAYQGLNCYMVLYYAELK